jgi:hypothetical protein
MDPDVEDELRTMLVLGETPTRALDRLAQDATYADRLPSLRTVERMRREVKPTGERWSFAASSPDEARFVLPVLAAVVEGYGSLSKETAGWIAKVRRAAPSLDPRNAFLWAIRYQAAAASGKDTAALDARFAREATTRAASASSS